MERIGIYGGTFAPPHNGHVRAAAAFLQGASLDHLYVMPASVPPHKQLCFKDDPALRLAMARMAFEGDNEKITVSDYEIGKGGISYTADTLEYMKSISGGKLFFLCGTDMFLTLPTWRRAADIFALATIVFVSREEGEALPAAVKEAALRYEAEYHAEILFLNVPPFPVSSSEIREKIARGEDVSDLVPESVLNLIKEHHLYETNSSDR